MSRRSVTSEIAIVSDETKAPNTAVISCWVMSLWATLPAVVGVEVASATIRLIFAPPSSAIPPAALISSATSSIPLRALMPNWAFAPDSAMITPTLIAAASALADDNTNGAASSAAVPDSSVRRFTSATPREFFLDIASPNFWAYMAPYLAAWHLRRLRQRCRCRLGALDQGIVTLPALKRRSKRRRIAEFRRWPGRWRRCRACRRHPWLRGRSLSPRLPRVRWRGQPV